MNPARLLTQLFCLLFPCCMAAQTVKGRVVDSVNGEPLFSAVVGEKGTSNGITTDFDGEFSLTVSRLPATLVISIIGYGTQEVEVTDAGKRLDIKMQSADVSTGEIEIVSDRVLQKQKLNPLTVENMDVIAIKEVASGNFYEGLAALKGVDMASASLAFRIINTRGFNSTSPVRVLQLIDGVDNQSPGLNFSLGNFLGAPDLDVKNVEIVQGASSAFFGPGAFNGVIRMETKNPFFTPGLSFCLKVGERQMFQPSLRWADSFNNKKGHAFLAYKLNLLYLSAEDWHADNYDPIYGSRDGKSNPGGFDAVNIYGDEYFGAFDYSDAAPYSTTYRGLGNYYRKGYKEEELVNYNTENIKGNIAVHLRLKPELDYQSPELIFQSSMGQGSTMYQGDNRFRLENIFFMQNRLELTKKDKFFIRAYITQEDAGKSYDPYFTALKLRDYARSQESWANVYNKYWQTRIIPRINQLDYPNLVLNPNPVNPPFDYFLPYDYEGWNNWMTTYSDSLFAWHNEVQNLTNTSNAGIPGVDSLGYLVPGTTLFNEQFNRIISAKNNEGDGGTRFFDRSKLYHAQAEYKWNFVDLDELRVGANARLYKPNSEGTIFSDTLSSLISGDALSGYDTTFTRNKISNFEFGLYAGAEKKFLEDRLILNATMRMDKNENYDALFSPALSAVFMPKKDHFVRASFSSALRNPTLTDQFLNLNVGPATLRGNLNGVQDLITIESFADFRNTQNPDTLVYFDIDPIRPERARTIEVGYRAMINNKIYVDASVYSTWYKDFIGYQLGLDAEFDSLGNLYYNSIRPYRYSANSKSTVITQGANVGVSWYFYKEHAFTCNYSYNKLAKSDENDPIIPAFNTPLHKFNFGFNGRDMWRAQNGNSWGYGFNYKWVDKYFWEGSPQFTGPVNAFTVIDAQINYTLDKQHLNIKAGCSNLLNNLHIEAYGGPQIGRLAYICVLYEWQKKN